MEYAIHLLALFIALNFLLKVGFYPRWGMWTVAAGCAFFAWLVTPWMTEQSKTVVAAFFASRPQMLNLSVCVTLEAAIMITFCFDCFAKMRTTLLLLLVSLTFPWIKYLNEFNANLRIFRK